MHGVLTARVGGAGCDGERGRDTFIALVGVGGWGTLGWGSGGATAATFLGSFAKVL